MRLEFVGAIARTGAAPVSATSKGSCGSGRSVPDGASKVSMHGADWPKRESRLACVWLTSRSGIRIFLLPGWNSGRPITLSTPRLRKTTIDASPVSCRNDPHSHGFSCPLHSRDAIPSAPEGRPDCRPNAPDRDRHGNLCLGRLSSLAVATSRTSATSCPRKTTQDRADDSSDACCCCWSVLCARAAMVRPPIRRDWHFSVDSSGSCWVHCRLAEETFLKAARAMVSARRGED